MEEEQRALKNSYEVVEKAELMSSVLPEEMQPFFPSNHVN
jgi:hypothetical protein